MPLKIPCKNIIDSPQGISVKIAVLILVSIGATSWNCWPYCALQSKRFELNKCGWPALSASSAKATSCFFREFSWWWCLGLSQVEISTLFCRSLLCIWTKSMKGSISTRYLIMASCHIASAQFCFRNFKWSWSILFRSRMLKDFFILAKMSINYQVYLTL